MLTDTDDLKMRILYLEKEIENCQNYIEKLEIKLKVNPFTRDTFKDTHRNYTYFSDEYWHCTYDDHTDITGNRVYSL